ncbi:MAG: HNH endonuclease signature motif containing protein [Bacteroidota bacterium]
MSRPKFSKKWRELIAKRAGHRCEYCKTLRAYAPSPFDIEHIKALSLGGLSILKNLAYSCHGCNLCKSNKIEGIDPETNKIVPLYNPRTSKSMFGAGLNYKSAVCGSDKVKN